MAAVNDITSRDEHLQHYLAQSSLRDELTTARESIPIYEHDQSVTYLNNTVDSTTPIEESNSYRINNSIKCTNVHSLGSEYVDINDMDFIENRGQTKNIVDPDHSQSNLLMRRSQRKIKKDDERKT